MPDLGHFIKSILHNERLSIVDVGSTGGPELRWRPWQELCFFYTFDPDPRAEPWKCSAKNYPIGLWSHKCEQTLHLATYPPASSLFQPNREVLSSFPTDSFLENVGTRRIELDTLDTKLAGQKVDFIKIDAEGSELEILKGAYNTLESCLGLQLEALFCPIRHNAPTFADLDAFARNSGFQLFHIQREHWLRKNRIATFESTPQLIWGNVLYLLPKKTFLNRLKRSENPKELFAKYLLILFAYNLHDYAYELCESTDMEEAKTLQSILASQKASKKEVLNLLVSLLVGAGKYALSFSSKSKQHRLSYLNRKVRQLGNACLHFSKNDFALYD